MTTLTTSDGASRDVLRGRDALCDPAPNGRPTPYIADSEMCCGATGLQFVYDDRETGFRRACNSGDLKQPRHTEGEAMKDTLPDHWVYFSFYADLVGDEYLKTVHHSWQEKPHTYREAVYLNWVIFGSKAEAKAIETLAFEQARQRHFEETGQDRTRPCGRQITTRTITNRSHANLSDKAVSPTPGRLSTLNLSGCWEDDTAGEGRGKAIKPLPSAASVPRPRTGR